MNEFLIGAPFNWLGDNRTAPAQAQISECRLYRRRGDERRFPASFHTEEQPGAEGAARAGGNDMCFAHVA